MAGTLTKDQILDGISELSVLELSELLKDCLLYTSDAADE